MSDSRSPAPGRFLTIDQVADELNVSAVQIRQLLRAGTLVGVKIGGRGQWRIERNMLEQFISDAYARTREAIEGGSTWSEPGRDADDRHDERQGDEHQDR